MFHVIESSSFGVSIYFPLAVVFLPAMQSCIDVSPELFDEAAEIHLNKLYYWCILIKQRYCSLHKSDTRLLNPPGDEKFNRQDANAQHPMLRAARATRSHISFAPLTLPVGDN